jgi:hypothetical protein
MVVVVATIMVDVLHDSFVHVDPGGPVLLMPMPMTMRTTTATTFDVYR